MVYTMKQFEQWQCAEIQITDTSAPHTVDCGIRAVFTAPSGKKIVREAFWNGENEFLIRFALVELGQWHYCIQGCKEEVPEAVISCVLYTGTLPLYQHGFLKVGPQGRYLSYADNTPFFWLGDTHWHFAINEKWAESNDSRFSSQFRALVDKRISQKFTVYQCNFHCEVPEEDMQAGLYFYKEEEWIPNLAFFQEDLDKKMAYLADNGFCIAAGFSWFFSAFAPNAKAYYHMAVRYLIARYGAYPMIWTLAGEVGGYNPSMREDSLSFWQDIAKLVERLDTYGHLQTAHYTNERPFAEYYQEETWFDFTLNQAGHGDYFIDSRPFRKHRTDYPTKPFIESESMYENLLTLEPNGRRRVTPQMLRRVAYIAMQTGACGYTYGAQGLWHLQWDSPKEDEAPLGFGSFNPWYESIDFPGADQMTVFRDFYEEMNWHTLKPLSEKYFEQDTRSGVMLTFKDDDMQALFMPVVSADDDMKTIVAYYSQANRFRIGLRTLTQPRYRAYWFNPENGEKSIIDENIVPEGGKWFAPVKPTESDALLILNAVE